MKLLRTLSTRSLVLLAAAVLGLSGGAVAIALAATGGGPTPPPEPLAQAVHDALSAPKPAGITAQVTFTNRLFPSGSLLGSAAALASGASGRLWLTNDGRGRLELQTGALGDVRVVWNPQTVSIYLPSTNTVYRASLPAHAAAPQGGSGVPPTLAQIAAFLQQLGAQATVSGARPTNVAGEPAYSVSISPKHDGGLLGSAELAFDALRGVPLRVAVYAQGSSSPVLEVRVTRISFDAVPSSDVDVAPPAGVNVVELSPPAQPGASQGAAVTGLAAVQAAAGFPVAAPDALVGLPRRDVRLVGGADSKTAIVVYGRGLGAIVVVERKADAAGAGGGAAGMLSALPEVSLDGITAHELATQLGTMLEWQHDGVATVLAGSLPPAAAEAAARAVG